LITAISQDLLSLTEISDARSMRLILLSAQNVRRKIVPLFLSEFPYLVAPLMLKRMQYSAMIADFTKLEILITTKRNLE
jgi:hypothetical protein